MLYQSLASHFGFGMLPMIVVGIFTIWSLLLSRAAHRRSEVRSGTAAYTGTPGVREARGVCPRLRHAEDRLARFRDAITGATWLQYPPPLPSGKRPIGFVATIGQAVGNRYVAQWLW